jgi:Tfp pilus assembly protein PilZ
VAQRLQVQFETEDELHKEFSTNIAKGGIFVATREPPELRSQVEIEIVLRYCDTSLSLDGEVVHCVPPELEAAGAEPGVAIHFDDTPAALREAFSPFTAGVSSSDPTKPGESRRVPRFRSTVATRIRGREGQGIQGRTRNLSQYGALVALDGPPVPVGEEIKVSITDPATGEELELDGTVMRHEVSQAGEVTGMGVEFHLGDSEIEESTRFLEGVYRREHSRRLGVISGPIEELGIDTVLNMFGTCSPCGTLTVTRDVEEGFVAVQGGMLRVARLGSARGQEALALMLGWSDGVFEFETTVDEALFEGEAVPLERALLEALQSQDEKRRDKIHLRANTKLRVDSDAVEEAAAELSLTDHAILELAGAGVTVGKIVEVIPEPKRDITQALSKLVKRGLIAPE